MGLLTPQDLRRVADALEARAVEANTVFSHGDHGPVILLRPEDWFRLNGVRRGEGRESGGFLHYSMIGDGVEWVTNGTPAEFLEEE